MKTVDSCFPLDEPEDQKLKHHHQSKALQQHNKGASHEGRFAALMNDNFRVSSDLETYVPQCS